MKKVVRLTETDLTRIVKRVIKENRVDRGILDDIDDEVAELPNDEVEDYCLSIIAHCEQIIQTFEILGDEDYDDEEDEDYDDEKTHNAFVQKIDDKIEFLLNGDYDDEPEYMEELYDAIVKLANTPTRKRAISYIENKLK